MVDVVKFPEAATADFARGITLVLDASLDRFRKEVTCAFKNAVGPCVQHNREKLGRQRPQYFVAIPNTGADAAYGAGRHHRADGLALLVGPKERSQQL